MSFRCTVILITDGSGEKTKSCNSAKNDNIVPQHFSQPLITYTLTDKDCNMIKAIATRPIIDLGLVSISMAQCTASCWDERAYMEANQ